MEDLIKACIFSFIPFILISTMQHLVQLFNLIQIFISRKKKEEK